MYTSESTAYPRGRRATPFSGLLLAAAGALLLSGCGGTKVYTPDKTLEYRGTIYNVSDVKQLSTRLEALPSSGEAIDLKGYDTRKADALLKERGPLVVRSTITMDDKAMVFEEKQVQKGRDISRMQEDLADAYKKLSRFMADAKKTQLKF